MHVLFPISPAKYKKILNIFFINSFIYFWLHWVSVAAHRLSQVAASRGYSLLRCVGFSLQWLLFVAEHGL